MKKLAAILAIISALLSARLIYPTTMEVIRIEEDSTYLMTYTGYVYEIERDDHEVGELYSCIMFSNGTPAIEDDVVLCAWYSGFSVN